MYCRAVLSFPSIWWEKKMRGMVEIASSGEVGWHVVRLRGFSVERSSLIVTF